MASRRARSPEDRNVAPVEQLLEAAAARLSGEPERREGRLVVSHAIWLCACETAEDSPTWVIYATNHGGMGWERVPDMMDVGDIVEAEHLTGCHPAPRGVLAWLRGERPGPWSGQADFPEHSYIYEEIRRRVHAG